MAVNPSFAITDENAAAVAEVVQRLDGLPLAIELAAARTRVLPVTAIRARLDQHLSLLTGGARDLPERQQTLRGAIDWSYDLLEGPDRRLFERFSVHAGGAYLTQADRVCGPMDELGEDVLDGLSSLAEKSLVKSGLNGSEDPRFLMLVTIRDYAHERLSVSDDHGVLERRHADTYLELVESLAPEILGKRAAEVTQRLDTDHDNIRAAIDWAVAGGRGRDRASFPRVDLALLADARPPRRGATARRGDPRDGWARFAGSRPAVTGLWGRRRHRVLAGRDQVHPQLLQAGARVGARRGRPAAHRPVALQLQLRAARRRQAIARDVHRSARVT